MGRFLRFAIAGGTSTAVVLSLTFGVSSVHLLMGDSLFDRDIILESFLLFPIVVGLVAGVWPSPGLTRSAFAAGTTGAVIGLAYGYCADRVLWAYMVGHWYWQSLGQIYWLTDVQAAVCGVVAGTCAMLIAVTRRSRPIIATAVILVLAAVLVPAPTFDLISHNQELTVAIVTPYTPGPTEEPREIGYQGWTSLDPASLNSMNNDVIGLLRKEGITGQYRVSEICRIGHGKKVLEVIVLNQPVANTVQLQEPRGGEVIYLQQPDGWKKIPPQLPTLSRSLTVEPPFEEDAFAEFKIYDASGSSSEFQVFKTRK